MGKINIFIYNNNNQGINLSEKVRNNLLQFLGLLIFNINSRNIYIWTTKFWPIKNFKLSYTIISEIKVFKKIIFNKLENNIK